MLMNMVGELVITQSMLGEIENETDLTVERVTRIREGLTDLARNTRALQESVMRIRSMPVSAVFNRFPRLVRDLARKLDKEIELQIKGEATELDKTILENLGDPLVHLVRNAIDHGLEGPDEREAAGKGRVGTLCLEAFHHGSDIMIRVSDDGRGLQRDRIRARAIERGLIGDAESLSDADTDELIFAPGFSTAESVSDLSGRGLGWTSCVVIFVRLGVMLRWRQAPVTVRFFWYVCR